MVLRKLTRRKEIGYTGATHENMCSWWHGLVRGACQSDSTSPSLFLVLAQPCVFPGLNIKAALSVNLYASTQDMLFCPKILSGTSWVVTDAMSHAPCITICPSGKRWAGARAG